MSGLTTIDYVSAGTIVVAIEVTIPKGENNPETMLGMVRQYFGSLNGKLTFLGQKPCHQRDPRSYDPQISRGSTIFLYTVTRNSAFSQLVSKRSKAAGLRQMPTTSQ